MLLEHGRGILHQVERAREELGRVRTGLTGRVALGMPPSVARVLTVPLMRAFRLALPEARLSISEGLTTAMQEGLLHGRLDIAMLYNANASTGLELTPLVREELLLARRPSAAAHRLERPGRPALGDSEPTQCDPHACGVGVGARWLPAADCV